MSFLKSLRALAVTAGVLALLVVSSSGSAHAQEKVDFAKQIKPILERSCLKCHTGDEPKGNLSLADKKLALKGGDSGPALVPKKPGDSPLLERVSLPPDDLLIMPAEGDKLAEAEIELIRNWIEQGAPWPEEITLKPAGDEAEPLPEAATRPLTDEERKVMDAIRRLGGHVLEIAQNDNRLEVAYHLADGKVTGEHLVPLKDLKDRVVHLNLRGTDVTDDDLQNLEELTGLTRLHLEKTGVGDKGLAHLKPLANLYYLNLYGTKVTDAGLQQLTGLKSLQKLYIWQSGVTADGVARIKQEMPELQVIPDLAAEREKARLAMAEARKKAEEAKKRAEQLQAAAAREQKKAQQARKALQQAQKAAEDAAKQAAAAQKKAEEAAKAAEQAKKQAEVAKKKAAAEQKKVDEAEKAAQQAAAKAQEAAKQAEELQKKAGGNAQKDDKQQQGDN